MEFNDVPARVLLVHVRHTSEQSLPPQNIPTLGVNTPKTEYAPHDMSSTAVPDARDRVRTSSPAAESVEARIRNGDAALGLRSCGCTEYEYARDGVTRTSGPPSKSACPASFSGLGSETMSGEHFWPAIVRRAAVNRWRRPACGEEEGAMAAGEGITEAWRDITAEGKEGSVWRWSGGFER